MSKAVSFVVYGEPVGKGRPRMTRNGHVYTPEKTANYETLVRLSYIPAEQGKFEPTAQIRADMGIYFTIPKSSSKSKTALMSEGKIRPVKKPDVDNCIKSVLDALNGIAYHDDSQVVEVEAKKFYSDTPRVEITLSEIEP